MNLLFLLGVSGERKGIAGGWVKVPTFCHLPQALATFRSILEISHALQINL